MTTAILEDKTVARKPKKGREPEKKKVGRPKGPDKWAFTVAIDPDVLAKFDALSKRRGQHKGFIVEKLLEQWLESPGMIDPDKPT